MAKIRQMMGLETVQQCHRLGNLQTTGLYFAHGLETGTPRNMALVRREQAFAIVTWWDGKQEHKSKEKIGLRYPFLTSAVTNPLP